MRFSHILVMAFAGISTVSSAAVIKQRDTTHIIDDLEALLVAVGYQLWNVTVYTGGTVYSQLVGLLGASNLITTVS
jgi:hypothetical protein